MVDQYHHQRHPSTSSQLSRKSLQTFQSPNNNIKSNNNRLSQGSLSYDMSTNTAVTSPSSLPDRPSLIPRHSKTNSYSSTTSSTSRNLTLDPGSPSKIPKPTLRHLNSHPPITSSNKNSKGSTQHQKKKSGMVNNISNEGEGRGYPITLPSDSHLVVPSLVTNSSTSDSLPTTNGLVTNVIPLGTPVETSKEKLSGILRFVGTTQFKEGTWAGIELHEKGKGKNDGSINGVRYFSCAPQSGIFVNYLAVRPSKPTPDHSKLSADKPSRSRLLTPDRATRSPSSPQPRKLPPAFKNRLNKVQTNSKQTLNSQPSTTASQSYGLRDKPSRSSLASSHHHQRNLKNTTEPVPIDQPLEALLDLTQGKFEDATDIDELFSLPNNNPSLVIKNLLSQLNTQRKENDLLRIRINKKRARIEATRVLKTEFIDKARQEIFSRRLSQNLHATDEPKSRAIQDQEEIIREISLKISQNDIEIDALKVRACEFPLFTDEGERGSPHQLERLQLDLQDLQGQLAIKEKLLTELKGEMDSFHLIIMSYSQQRDSSTVKSRLNEIMHELESLREASVVEAASLRTEIDQLHSQLQKYSEPGTGEQQQLDLTSKYHQLLESLEVANRRHQESDLKLQEYQRSQETLVSEHQTKIQEYVDKIEHLTRENLELQQQLTALQADASDLAELKKELADNQVTIDNLNHDIDELHQYIEEVTQNQEGYEEGGITPAMYEELKTEKDHYVTSLETIQKEKNELLIQMQALKAALYKLEEVSYRENEKSDSLDSEKTVIPDPNLGKLESRIRQLEDELVTAKSINQKIKEGTLTQDDLHDSLAQDIQVRDTTIVRLESEVKEAEGYIQELIKENDGLITDNKAFEEDNWRLDDMYNEVTKELEFKTKEANEYKDKVKLLKEALEAAAQTSDSARKMNELMLKVDEIEAYFNSEIDTLLKDLTEFDEDLKAAGKREETLLSEIQSLKQRLSHPYATDPYAGLSDEELDADALNALDLGDKTICHLCLGDHEPEVCPDPMALANDEADVLELEGLLDDSYDLSYPDPPTLICSDCQEPGHSYQNCPNSAEVY